MASTETPLITVITPAYNVGEYIDEAMASVLGQTERRFEYLVVDDGSTDDTVARIEAQSDSRLRLLRSDHAGSAAARNLGLAEARGTYIAFLDGDDRWDTDFLASQLALLTSLPSEVGAVFCRARVMTQTGRVVFRRWQRAGRCDFDDMLVLNCPPRNGSSLLIKKQAFDEAGVFSAELQSGIDFEMWLRMGTQSSVPVFWGSAEYLLDLRLRPGAISNNLDRRFSSMGALLDQYGPHLRRTPLGRAYIRPAILAFRAGYDQQAEAWLRTVRSAGWRAILTDRFGLPLLAWALMPSVVRRFVRTAKGTVRNGVLQGPRLLARRP